GLSQLSHAGQLVQIDSELRQTLEILKLNGVLNVDISTWPISSEAIETALSQAQPKSDNDKLLLNQVKQKLEANDVSKLQIVSNVNGDERAVFSGFNTEGNTVTPLGVSISHSHAGENIDYKIQGTLNVEDDEPSKLSNLDGSLIRSDAARPVTGFLMQRANNSPINFPVLSKFGNFNYQITAGQLQDYKAEPHAKLIGMRASFQPHEAFQIGASRSLMWGGDNKSESLKSLGKALIGKYDNGGEAEDPSNQIAGIDAQLNLKPLVNLPVSVYGEFIGEDEAGGLPSKHAYLAGLKGTIPLLQQPWLWHAEWANTYYDLDKTRVIYRHSTYKDGYYQKGLPLGHPIGGDGEIISVGLSGNINANNQLGLKYANAKVNQSKQVINSAFPTKQNLDIVEADWKHKYNDKTSVKLGIWGKKDSI
ncbi:MAG: capsule assembly Wzi family protein, partial [Moraxella osloensis]|nr:capsule assembly Wzi family protein [Moraxella osloensis]